MLFVNLLCDIATAIANVGSQACLMVLVDEPECPNSLLK